MTTLNAAPVECAEVPEARKHTLVFRILIAVLPRILDWYLRLVDWTSRKVVLHPERDGCKLRRQATCFVAFHQSLLCFMQHFRDRGGVVMASRSRDGDLIAAVLARFGYRSARGSDSKAGEEALTEMTALLRDDGVSGGLTCDGPRGPYGAVKMGVIVLARDSGRPIVPCAMWMTRKWLAGNWDHTMLPLPFSRITFVYGEPIHVPLEATWEECKLIRDRVAAGLMDLLFEAQDASGEPRRDFRRPLIAVAPQAAAPALPVPSSQLQFVSPVATPPASAAAPASRSSRRER